MASVIWCDHIKHVVEQSRTEVADTIATVAQHLRDTKKNEPFGPTGFAFFTESKTERPIALNVTKISSFQAYKDDGI